MSKNRKEKNAWGTPSMASNLLYILTKIKSEKSTFVFKSPENKDNANTNYYQINK